MNLDPNWRPPTMGLPAPGGPRLTAREQSAMVDAAAVIAVLTTRCLAGLPTGLQDIADACLVSRADAEHLLKACEVAARDRCEAACERIRQGIG